LATQESDYMPASLVIGTTGLIMRYITKPEKQEQFSNTLENKIE